MSTFRNFTETSTKDDGPGVGECRPGEVWPERQPPLAGTAGLPCLSYNNSIESHTERPLGTGRQPLKIGTPVDKSERKKDRYGREWVNGQWTATEAATERMFERAESGDGPAGISWDNPAVVITPPERKKAFTLAENVKYLADRYGVQRIGFLTLTFAEEVTDFREANRRFNSLRSNFLKGMFDRFMVVVEPTKAGRIHFHLLVVCGSDIRTGFDFDAVAKRDYRSANEYLRGVWKVLREAMPRYGFGRSELMPIRSTSEGMARYVGKYIGKGSRYRGEQFKGARMVRYSQGWRSVGSRWSWMEHGREWRSWVGDVARILGVPAGNMDVLRDRYGRHWAFKMLRLFEQDVQPFLAAAILTQGRSA